MSSSLSSSLLNSAAFSRRSDALGVKFLLDAGPFKTIAESPSGKALSDLLCSDGAVLIMAGAALAAPSRPPVAALAPFIERRCGTVCFADDFKRLTGRWVRQIMQHLGARYRRSHVPVMAKGSPFKSGSVYTFGSVALHG